MRTVTSAPADFDRWFRDQKPKTPAGGVPTTEAELQDAWRVYKGQAADAIRDARQIVHDAAGKRNPDQDFALDVAARQLERDFHEWIGKSVGKTVDQVEQDLKAADLEFCENWYDSLLDTIHDQP